MILIFKGSFLRDISKIRDRHLKTVIRESIQNARSAKDIRQIHKLVKLRKYKIHYRIEIEGNYRIGLIIRDDKMWFVRALHRSKIYKAFP
jgi:hypothetical protein